MVKQRGGSSDFMHSFYSSTAVGGPAAISQATLAGIGNSPMFNPLSATATIPGPSTGITPTGLYLASQHGGAPIEQLRDACNDNNISCRGPNGGYLGRNTLVKKLQTAGGETCFDKCLRKEGVVYDGDRILRSGNPGAYTKCLAYCADKSNKHKEKRNK
jgi:hypothetical protein